MRSINCAAPAQPKGYQYQLDLRDSEAKLLDYLTEENAAHFRSVERYLDALGCRVVVDPSPSNSGEQCGQEL